MKLIKKTYKTNNDKYYELHLKIINAILPVSLTEKEIKVLAKFMSLDKNIIKEDVFNVIARKKVKDALSLSNGGLSNYLKSMIKKGFLLKNEITKKIIIRDFLLPEDNEQYYKFKIIKE